MTSEGPQRYALAIGVKKSGKLTPLLGALNDVTRFERWADKNKYITKPITDADGTPVTTDRLKEAIACILKNDVERLLIFYSGHGISTNAGDFWLLSNIEDDGDEAVNVALSVRNARRHQINQLAIFSDCCRSSVNFAGYVGGSSIFPRSQNRAGKYTEYDEFFSTDAGAISQEVKPGQAEKSFGVFSNCLMDALEGMSPEAFTDRDSRRLVCSTSLTNWLEKVVPLESGRIPGGIVQYPSITPSWRPPADDYLEIIPSKNVKISDDKSNLDPDDLSRGARDLVTIGVQLDFDDAYRGSRAKVEESKRSREIDLQQLEKTFNEAVGRRTFETRLGLTVFGAEVAEVVSEKGFGTDVFSEGDVFQIRGHEGPARSVVLKLSDGHWIPSLILPNFIGSIVVDAGAVLSVNYSPAHNTPLYQGEDASAADVARWNALMNMGRKQSASELTVLGRELRRAKHVNPALGILAAYAFERVGDIGRVEDIAAYFSARNAFIPFDVAALIGMDVVRYNPANAPVVGKYPLLSRGWTLLEKEQFGISPKLIKLRSGMMPGPWISLKGKQGQKLAEYIHEGVI